MTEDIRLGVILASTRKGRRGEGFARWILELLGQRPGLRAELLDLKDWPIGPYEYDVGPTAIEKSYPDELHRRWSEKIASFDAYVIVTPEYNHGYPGHLKNAIDHVYKGWSYKPVGFVAYGGTASGARAVEQLRSVAVELRMVPVRGEVNIRLIGLQQDGGKPTDPFYATRGGQMIDEVLWWARVAREGREKHGLPG